MLNGQFIEAFLIKHGVWEGCLLTPYLFFFISKALSMATKAKQRIERINGILLPASEE